MQLNSNDNFLKRNSYLLLAAAWLLTLAFIINNYWSVTSTPHAIQKRIQVQVTKKEKEINHLFSDSVLIESIINQEYDKEKLADLVNRNYYIFTYRLDAKGWREIFWNTQDAHPDSAAIYSRKTESFSLLNNG